MLAGALPSCPSGGDVEQGLGLAELAPQLAQVGQGAGAVVHSLAWKGEEKKMESTIWGPIGKHLLNHL